MHGLLEQANRIAPELIQLRRELHRHPELSFREHRTAATIEAAIRALGFRVRTGVGRTGIVAELGEGQPIVALRADMDALPIQEANQHDYCSSVSGVMHACGHDAHMAMLTGAARLLAQAEQNGQLKGTVRLLFQPSEEASDEENKSGAVRMIEDGAMAGVAAVFGLHIGAHLEAGKAYIRAGPYMAGSDVFTATVHGKSAHAARPQEGVDAIVLAAHAILACQNVIARRVPPSAAAVLTIGRIAGGVAENVIAETVKFHGTLRYFEPAVRSILHRELKAALGVVDALGGQSKLDLRFGYPPVINDTEMTEIARNAAAAVLGVNAIAPYEPMMGAEDFAYLLQKAPGCFFWLGAALEPPREHHHPNFDIDEKVLPKGAALLAACALAVLHKEL
jgi:IAA-amino acid hydrolase